MTATKIASIVMIVTLACFSLTGTIATADAQTFCLPGEPAQALESEPDRIWMVSTRALTTNACNADLESPNLRVSRLRECGEIEPSTLQEYLGGLSPDRPVVVYVHGNLVECDEVVQRGLRAYRKSRTCPSSSPIDWVIFSWPSDETGCIIGDAREKVKRIGAQALYLAWFTRHHSQAAVPMTMIGYSFGGRVVTGSLHTLAGGAVDGRCLPWPHITDERIRVGLIAPALYADWLLPSGYHGKASHNIEHLLLLHNSRDILLRNLWRLYRDRGNEALGAVGLKRIGPRTDGTVPTVRSIDYASFIRQHHGERYYLGHRSTGAELSFLIHPSKTRHGNQSQ